jgi:hypothetical protein
MLLNMGTAQVNIQPEGSGLIRDNERIQSTFKRPVGVNAAGMVAVMKEDTVMFAATGDRGERAVTFDTHAAKDLGRQSCPSDTGFLRLADLGAPRALLFFEAAASVTG